MPVLNWIGKEAVVKHHKEVPFRLLEPVAELSCGLSTTPSSEHTEKNSPPYEGGVADAAFQAADGVVLPDVVETGAVVANAENHPVGEAPPPLLRKEGSLGSAFLGTYKDRAVFLLYNGILKDKTVGGGNVLNSRTLEYINGLLPDFEGERVIYGARSRFDKTKLEKLGITFHQLPYDLAVKTWF